MAAPKRCTHSTRLASQPVRALTVLVEVMAYRGYEPLEIVGMAPEDLEYLRHQIRTHVKPGRTPLQIRNLPISLPQLRRRMVYTNSHFAPVARFRVRDDVPPWCPARVANDRPGDEAWVMMVKRVSVPPADVRGKILDTFNTDVTRAFLDRHREEVRRAIIVTSTKLYVGIKPIMFNPRVGVVCETFLFNELQANPLRHCLTPWYEVLSPHTWHLAQVHSRFARGTAWTRLRAEPGSTHHRGTVRETFRDPVVTPMGDAVVRILALPQGTLLRIHMRGMLSTHDPPVTRVDYVHGDDIRSMVE